MYDVHNSLRVKTWNVGIIFELKKKFIKIFTADRRMFFFGIHQISTMCEQIAILHRSTKFV